MCSLAYIGANTPKEFTRLCQKISPLQCKFIAKTEGPQNSLICNWKRYDTCLILLGFLLSLWYHLSGQTVVKNTTTKKMS